MTGCGTSKDSDTGKQSGSSAEGEAAVGGEVAVDEWQIPVLSAVTGAIAYVGGSCVMGQLNMRLRQINEAGGINGVPVSIEIYDTKFDTAEVASCLSQVVDDSIIVVGPMDAPAARWLAR